MAGRFSPRGGRSGSERGRRKAAPRAPRAPFFRPGAGKGNFQMAMQFADSQVSAVAQPAGGQA
jgi:hypothetical protein